MSLRNVVEGSCGEMNPMMKVASHFTNDFSLRESINVTANGTEASTSPQMFGPHEGSNISMLPPTSFRMETLLKELQSIDGHANAIAPPIQGPRPSDVLNYASADSWTAEFQHGAQDNTDASPEWVGEFKATKNIEAPSSTSNFRGLRPGPLNHTPGFPAMRYSHHQPPQSQYVLRNTSPHQSVIGEAINVDIEGLTAKTELMLAADQVLEASNDSKILASDFMKYVERISSGEIVFNENGERQEVNENKWVNDFQQAVDEEKKEQVNSNFRNNETFWNDLESEWARLAAQEDASNSWLGMTENLEEKLKTYVFASNNPYVESSDPLEEGKVQLRLGNIPKAVLLFESAAQKQGNNPECWYLLGFSQSLNEQDPQAISALYKCLELNPEHQHAYMSLAASLANESYHAQACDVMKWIKSNPDYSHLIPEDSVLKINTNSTLISESELNKLKEAFLNAARMNSTENIDPDVQCGLGILFTLDSQYSKAADCFQSALSVSPNDALLWNRLGASLANGSNSAEAVGAYRKALELLPGFIRTRYNLGIACVNLGAYREAAEHFLYALGLQAKSSEETVGKDEKKAENYMSESIWSSLRMVLHLMDKPNLTPLVDARDLKGINDELKS